MSQTIKSRQIISYTNWSFSPGADWDADISNADSAYAKSDVNGARLEAKLELATDPIITSGHKIHYRAKYNHVFDTEPIYLKFTVRVGSDIKYTWNSPSLSDGSYTSGSHSISSINITDYDDLRLSAQIQSSLGLADVFIDYMYMEVPDLPAPGTITGVSATDGTYTGKVRITWNSDPYASTYQIYRSLSSGTGYSAVKSDATGTSWEDTGVTAGVTYYYKMKGKNADLVQSSSYSNVNSGYAALGSVNVSPSAITAGANSQAPSGVVYGSLSVTPVRALARTRTKTPLQLEETDVDSFFSYMAQPFGYTNYNTRQRDTWAAVDPRANLIYFLFPTSSSTAYSDQLPRVMYAINLVDHRIGLVVPTPLGATGPYTPLKSKNVFMIREYNPGQNAVREAGIFAVTPATVTADDTTSTSEYGSKEYSTIASDKWIGFNSSYGDAMVTTKFFRPPTKKPDTKTRIMSVKPAISSGHTSYIAGLKFRGHLWTFDSMIENDAQRAEAADVVSSIRYNDETIYFEGSTYGLEHVIGISIDTTDGDASFTDMAKSLFYSSGAITHFEIEYEEQSRNKF